MRWDFDYENVIEPCFGFDIGLEFSKRYQARMSYYYLGNPELKPEILKPSNVTIVIDDPVFYNSFKSKLQVILISFGIMF